MRMRTGRLNSGYFKNAGGLPSRYLRWKNEILLSTGVLSASNWFSVDNTTGLASMVNHNDVDGNVLWQLAGYLEGDEAVAIVREHEFVEYRGKRQWRPTAAEGPMYHRPPCVITGNDLTDCTLQIPLADVIELTGFLVVKRRIYALRILPDIGLERCEVVPPDAISSLFADS